MSNCYVFRINYDEMYGSIRKELIDNGILRQGWGAPGMDLRKGIDSFKKAWEAKWPGESKDYVESKYYNLNIMLSIKMGDYIVIPKISSVHENVCRSFIIAKCCGEYSFDNGIKDDFGHFIRVEKLISCAYDSTESDTDIISSKFRAYQRSLNSVKNQDFINSVANIIDKSNNNSCNYTETTEKLIKKISNATNYNRKQYIISVLDSLRLKANDKFEKLISELFEKNGYVLIRNNYYDKEGGDIDLVFQAFEEQTLLNDISNISGNAMPLIYVQAKKKTGRDYNDIEGVEQIILMRKEDKVSISILINLTDDFSQETIRKARENNIMLINGFQFASLLIKYGIDVEY